MSAGAFTCIGLVLDIIGALVVWYFVAEVNFADKADFLQGKATLVVADPTQEEIRRYKRRINMSRLGAALLVGGFLLQLVGNIVP